MSEFAGSASLRWIAVRHNVESASQEFTEAHHGKHANNHKDSGHEAGV